MKKIITVFVLYVVVISCMLTLFTYGLKKMYISRKCNLEKHIGKSIELNNDTLKVIDYSLINNTLTLSNGVVVSVDITKEDD